VNVQTPAAGRYYVQRDITGLRVIPCHCGSLITVTAFTASCNFIFVVADRAFVLIILSVRNHLKKQLIAGIRMPFRLVNIIASGRSLRWYGVLY